MPNRSWTQCKAMPKGNRVLPQNKAAMPKGNRVWTQGKHTHASFILFSAPLRPQQQHCWHVWLLLQSSRMSLTMQWRP